MHQRLIRVNENQTFIAALCEFIVNIAFLQLFFNFRRIRHAQIINIHTVFIRRLEFPLRPGHFGKIEIVFFRRCFRRNAPLNHVCHLQNAIGRYFGIGRNEFMNQFAGAKFKFTAVHIGIIAQIKMHFASQSVLRIRRQIIFFRHLQESLIHIGQRFAFCSFIAGVIAFVINLTVQRLLFNSNIEFR